MGGIKSIMSTVDDRTQKQLEEDIRLLKGIRSRGQIPLITERPPENAPPLANVQGDVLHRFPKSYERFLFFRIKDPTLFRVALKNFKPTSSQDVKDTILQIAKVKDEAKRAEKPADRVKLKQYLIGFSRTGLYVLNIQGKTGDERFDKYCMRDNRVFLGDQGRWDKLFDKSNYNEKEGSVHDIENPDALHGVIAIATDNKEDCDEATEDVKKIFGESWAIPDDGIVDGNVRPDPIRHHEHFGYKDGISQPAVRGIEYPLPGQIQVDPGVIVMGYDGDPVPNRPEWCKDGTMMVFRKLEQSVLLFDKYTNDNGPRWKEFFPGGKEAADRLNPPLTNAEGAELFGARFVGRWKSGAPLPLAPIRDDRELGDDPKRNNNFDYTVRDVAGVSSLTPSDYYCPFTAHSRKTVPRNLDPYISRRYLESGAIVRAAIPYGPEVTDEERQAWKPPPAESNEKKRGLLFNCYASHLDSGFVRQTTGYGNNDFFPITGLTPVKHGQDPIIGGPPPTDSSGEERGASLEKKPTHVFKTGDQVDIKLQVPGDTLNRYRVNGHIEVQPLTQVDPPGADNPFFVTSRGGEYFFVPSIPTLKSWASSQ
ncbi:unnamed protein product [Rhizoctonia solani]|uniref:DyP dimeric alpha+beta barrel domain-containing protein n=1 Tax=Rhizoctonia solani TaxID=456999 RepID=A0A8H3AUH7_9AGAM|nr:unnamed protein product [Rhizoctonia solani]